MCRAMEMLIAEGEERGEIRGEQRGIQMARNIFLLNKKRSSREEIAEILGISGEMVDNVLQGESDLTIRCVYNEVTLRDQERQGQKKRMERGLKEDL